MLFVYTVKPIYYHKKPHYLLNKQQTGGRFYGFYYVKMGGNIGY